MRAPVPVRAWCVCNNDRLSMSTAGDGSTGAAPLSGARAVRLRIVPVWKHLKGDVKTLGPIPKLL
jgi:hypothetical protein